MPAASGWTPAWSAIAPRRARYRVRLPLPASSRVRVSFSVLELVVGVALRERQLILQTAQDEIVARHLGDDADTRILQRRGGGADVARGRFDVAPDAAEQIELPQPIEAGLGRIELAVDADRRPAIPAGNPGCAYSCPQRSPSDTDRSRPIAAPLGPPANSPRQCSSPCCGQAHPRSSRSSIGSWNPIQYLCTASAATNPGSPAFANCAATGVAVDDSQDPRRSRTSCSSTTRAATRLRHWVSPRLLLQRTPFPDGAARAAPATSRWSRKIPASGTNRTR